MLAFTPLQGFTADSIISSALDNVTLVESNGKAQINLNNPNDWTALQTYDTYGPYINNIIASDSAFGVWNYAGNVANGVALNLGALQLKYDNSTTNTGMIGMRGWTDNTGALTGFQLWFFSYVLSSSAFSIDYFTGDIYVRNTILTESSLGTAPINTQGNTTMASGLNAQYLNYSNRTFAFQNSLSGVYDTTSTTPVSTGGGITLSNIITNVGAFMIGSVQISNNTLGDYVTAEVYRSTVGIPAAGTAPPSTDTIVASYSIAQEGLGSNSHIFSFMDYVAFSNSNSSLSPSPTTYYWYLAIYANAGTAFAEAMQMAAVAM